MQNKRYLNFISFFALSFLICTVHLNAMRTGQDGEDVLDAPTKLFRIHLEQVSALITLPTPRPTVFLSYAWDNEGTQGRVETIAHDLLRSGIPYENILIDRWANRPGSGISLFKHADKIGTTDKVIIIGSPTLKQKYDDDICTVTQELDTLRVRMNARGGKVGVIPIWFSGKHSDNFPIGLQSGLIALSMGEDYHTNFFELLISLYAFNAADNPIKTIKYRMATLRAEHLPHLVVQHDAMVTERHEAMRKRDRDDLRRMLGLESEDEEDLQDTPSSRPKKKVESGTTVL